MATKTTEAVPVPAQTTGAPRWCARGRELSLASPRLMAIFNATPDSFFDGGALSEGGAIDEGRLRVRYDEAVREGAALLDVGGESTRPGACPVAPADEWHRIETVLRRLLVWRAEAPEPWISVDTRRAEVARRALALGVEVVNDVSGLADPEMAGVVAEHAAGLVIGHLRGEPKTMQQAIHFVDVIDEVAGELSRAVDRAVAAGVPRAAIVVDPCLGFGKTAEQSGALLLASETLRAATGCPVLIGASRKSFLGALAGVPHVEDRERVSALAAALAAEHGAAVLRVHDLAATAEALRFVAGLARARVTATGIDPSAPERPLVASSSRPRS